MSAQQHHQTAEKDRVSIGQKFAYGLGSIVNNLLGSAIGYMSIILNVGLGMNPALVGALQAIPRLTDAFTDPIMGHISDNTRSKFGRRRPYIFIGAIGVGIIFALMWQLPYGKSEMFYFGIFLTGSILFYLFYTIFATPWVALGYELTEDYHERTRVQGVTNFMGQIAWIILPWFYAFMENDRIFSDSVQGARMLAIMIGALVIVLGIMPAIFTRERYVMVDGEKHKESLWKGVARNIVMFFSGLGTTLKNREFLKLAVGTFFMFNGMMLVGAFSSYIIIFYVSGGDNDLGARYIGLYGTINTISTFLAITLVTWISTKLGKRRTFMLATASTLIGSLLKWFSYDPMAPWKVLLPAPLIAIGMGGLFTLMGSMMADVCDLDELKTGKRREGMYSSIYWWTVKLGMSLAFALSGILLNKTGFLVDLGGAQSSGTFLQMRIFDVLIPASCAAIAIVAVKIYRITEDKSYEIRQQLQVQRAKLQTIEVKPTA